jgi:hypothetical protein
MRGAARLKAIRTRQVTRKLRINFANASEIWLKLDKNNKYAT